MASVFETHDVDEAHHMLERTYAGLRMSVIGDRHYLKIRQDDLGPVALRSLTFRMRFTAEIPSISVVSVARCLAGTVTRQAGDGLATGGPGDLLLVGQPEHGYRARTVNHRGEGATFPPGLFAQVADAAPARAPRPIRFTGDRPLSERAKSTWNRTYDYVRDAVAGTPAGEEPLLVGSAVQLLTVVTLATFPNTALREPTAEDRRDAHPATLRRATAFIEANPHRDITPADIAAAARVSIRALQLAFRRHLGTTPTGYLRRVRLEQAHRQLLAADPATTSVSAVASRWGFASHSSFTAHYRAAYGVTPSRTLRRR